MKKVYIYVLTLTSLTNDKHIAITAFMANALHAFSVAETIPSNYVAAYIDAYNRENEAFMRTDNKVLHEVIVPVDYQMTESEYPTPPEGTHWNYTLADLNLAIGMKNPGDTITVRAQAD